MQEDGISSILISCHQKVLPNNIIKMLANWFSCIFSFCVWSSCLGASLSVNMLHCITHLHNCGVRMTSGLHKYDHVSHYKFVIVWLPVSSVNLHCSLIAMYEQYRCNHCLLNLQNKFGQHSSYHTRISASFANIFRYNLTFSKKFFWSKATNWWNNLPITLISSSDTKFSRKLYNYLLYTWLFV